MPALSDNSHSTVAGRAQISWLGYVIQLVQVRLRFILIVGAIFAIVACWPRLAHYWDRLVIWTTGASSSERGISADTEYFCPMCPGVLNTWPEKCPVCKMPLVRRKRGEAALLPEGVVARMQLSPYRVQLAGIKTSQVSYLPLMREVKLTGKFEPSMSGDNPKILADLSPLDLPLVFVSQQAELTVPHDTAPVRLTGKVVSWGPKNTSNDSYRLVIQPESNAASLPPGMRVGIRLRIAAADLEPLKSQPRNPPPLKKGIPRAVFLCPDHPSYLHLKAGKCPFDENSLHEHQLLPNQRLDWWCPVHPHAKHADPGACATCSKMKLLPRVLTYAPPAQVLAVPESAVIDTGSAQFVFVETMPGMFDCFSVELAPQAGGYYPVVAGLLPGQRVAASGAFLLDAETRLNSSLAASYFGAGAREGQFAATPQVSSAGETGDLLSILKLSPEQLVLARRQRTCPITRLPLGSMGELVEVQVADRSVFLCCEGCRSRVKTTKTSSKHARSPATTPTAPAAP
ncbi:MAG: heavy metal-binding domain-containing protein [Pirellulaceae bacterium]